MRRRSMCAGSSLFTSVQFMPYPYRAKTASASGAFGIIFSSTLVSEKVMLSRKIALTCS
jgi:hypothetical protein